ncbi:hypothetical protein XENTR_v10018804 [Xenopus tropicalis]|nr:hypothetical protein XENTR_v10018804 [Xenopus tropicalis]
MEDVWEDDSSYTVFSGSCERDVSLCKIFWNSVTLQPPLESRLVSGDIEQRLRAAGSTKQNKNIAHQQPVDNIISQQFTLPVMYFEGLTPSSMRILVPL